MASVRLCGPALCLAPGRTQDVLDKLAVGAATPHPRPGTRGLSPPLADTESGLWVSPLFSVVMTVASSGSPQPCLVLADSRKTYADSGASSVAVNCLTVAPTSTVVKVLGLLLARR